MKSSYIIITDHDKSMLIMTLSGFFDLETVREFAKARNAAVDSLKCGINEHVTLCDIRKQLISSQRILAELKNVISDSRYSSKKLAFVVTGTLPKMQTMRIINRDKVSYFKDSESAKHWLSNNIKLNNIDNDDLQND